MSPRKLDQIRENGQSIMNQTHSTNRSQKRRQSSQMHTSVNALRHPDAPIYEEEDSAPKMHLVPCRWAPGGWKYVEMDPKGTRFFNSPNRVNTFGVQPGDSRRNAKSVNRAAGDSGIITKSYFETSYGRFFANGK